MCPFWPTDHGGNDDDWVSVPRLYKIGNFHFLPFKLLTLGTQLSCCKEPKTSEETMCIGCCRQPQLCLWWQAALTVIHVSKPSCKSGPAESPDISILTAFWLQSHERENYLYEPSQATELLQKNTVFKLLKF